MRGPASRAWAFGRGTPLRIVVLAVYGYLALVLIGNGVILLGVATARLAGKDPRVDLAGLPEVKHLRQVDASMWAGGTPSPDDYERFADLGVSTVINLREGVPGDEAGTSISAAAAGLDYVRVPIVDGRAPDRDQVERILAAIRNADGDVFIHCGGGVGRTTSTTAAYEAAVGRDPSLWPRIAIGPMSFEQAWFIVAAEPNQLAPDAPIIDVLSRYVIDAPRRVVNLVETII